MSGWRNVCTLWDTTAVRGTVCEDDGCLERGYCGDHCEYFTQEEIDPYYEWLNEECTNDQTRAWIRAFGADEVDAAIAIAAVSPAGLYSHSSRVSYVAGIMHNRRNESRT